MKNRSKFYTSIELRKTTVKLLQKFGNYNDTYDSIIIALMGLSKKFEK